MRAINILGAVAILSSTMASAVTVTSTPGAPDPGAFAGQSIVVSFDNANAAGYSFSGAITTTSTSIPNLAAAPAGDTTAFGYISSAIPNGIATLTTPNLKSISFYWGSIDTFNFVDVLGAGGVTLSTVVGGAIPPANGDQSAPATNRRVNFVAGPGEVITGLRLRSTGVAFEVDNFAAAAVPEPATWAMLVAGFGLVGFATRRRRLTVVAA